MISRLIDHFALNAAKPGQGLSKSDVRIGENKRTAVISVEWI